VEITEKSRNIFPIWKHAQGAWGRAGLWSAKPPDGGRSGTSGGLPCGLRPQAPWSSGSREVISGLFPKVSCGRADAGVEAPAVNRATDSGDHREDPKMRRSHGRVPLTGGPC
jgi:hypothetical protein